MGYKTELQSNNTDFSSILDVVNSLPEPIIPEVPTISVSSGGLITASANDLSATQQLTVRSAQTITPSTSNKTIAAGQYLTGKQTIKGDANLIPENILEGISIFGVLGTASGGDVVTGTCGGFSGGKFVINEAVGKKNMIITINNPGAISSYEMLCASYINGQTSLTYASTTSLSYFYVNTDINQGVSYNPDTGTMTVSRDVAGASHTQLMDQVYRYFAF